MTAVFLLSSFTILAVPMVRVKLHSSATSVDETVLYYQAGATAGFDSEYDAYKLAGPNPAPRIAQQYGNVVMVINGISPPLETFTIALQVYVPVAGMFTITADDFQEMPAGTSVQLQDLVTGKITDLISSACSFTLSAGSYDDRFLLLVVPPAGENDELIAEPDMGAEEDSLKTWPGKGKGHGPSLEAAGHNRFYLQLSRGEGEVTRLEVSEMHDSRKKYSLNAGKCDAEGKLLIDLSACSAGIYLLTVGSDDRVLFRGKVLLD